MLIRKYKELISNMPVMDRACDSKRSTWDQFAKQDRKLAKVLKDFRNNDKRIVISRGDLFKLARQGVSKEFVYATYIWGYPNGNRGRYRKVFNQVYKILEVFKKLPTQITEDEWLREYKNLRAIDEMGMSTWTKLLYFLRIRIGGVKALILDGKVVEVMQRRVFRDFTMLAKITYGNAPKRYPYYLRVMYDTAEELKVAEDKLEMFLFTFGNSLKKTTAADR